MKRFLPSLLVIAVAIGVSALLPPPQTQSNADLGEVARSTGIRVLGATRGYATTALWLRAGESYRRGDFHQTLATYQIIRELQPRNPAVYSYLSWNEGYNISAQFPERDRREDWVARGLKTLHDGQDRLPRDASLRMDEWHYALNRSVQYPTPVLSVELKRFGDANPVWALLVERTLELEEALSDPERAELGTFLNEAGLGIDIYDRASEWLSLTDEAHNFLLTGQTGSLTLEDQKILRREFPESEIFRIGAALELSDAVSTFLGSCHWCRLHAMLLALGPALDFERHSSSIDSALLNTWQRAWQYLPPELPAQTEQEFRRSYKEGVAKAFIKGIENAHRVGGADAVDEFVDRMRFNFNGLEELLPKKLIDSAHQEIQE